MSSIGEDPGCRRRLQHSIHQRHHGHAEGRGAHAFQHRQQRLLRRRRHAAHGRRPRLHPGAAVSLLRHGARGAGGHDAWRGQRVPRRRLRAAGGAPDRCQRAVHRAARRAHDVHRGAGASALRRIRPVIAAHRHHGRIAVSDRGDAPGGRRDAHAGGDDLLRHDGDQSSQLPDSARRLRSSGVSVPWAGCIRTCR